MKKSTILRAVILTFWIVGILAPAYTFSRASPVSRAVFDKAFQTQASHILMHMFLYAVLAYLLASVFPQTSSAKRLFLPVLATVAVLAAMQEAIQAMSGGISFGFDEVFDFCVDLAGGLIGTWLYVRFHREKTESTATVG